MGLLTSKGGPCSASMILFYLEVFVFNWRIKLFQRRWAFRGGEGEGSKNVFTNLSLYSVTRAVPIGTLNLGAGGSGGSGVPGACGCFLMGSLINCLRRCKDCFNHPMDMSAGDRNLGQHRPSDGSPHCFLWRSQGEGLKLVARARGGSRRGEPSTRCEPGHHCTSSPVASRDFPNHLTVRRMSLYASTLHVYFLGNGLFLSVVSTVSTSVKLTLMNDLI